MHGNLLNSVSELTYRKTRAIVSFYARLDQIFSDNVINLFLFRRLIENSVKNECSLTPLSWQLHCLICVVYIDTQLATCVRCIQTCDIWRKDPNSYQFVFTDALICIQPSCISRPFCGRKRQNTLTCDMLQMKFRYQSRSSAVTT